jgi:hypothetical protein
VDIVIPRNGEHERILGTDECGNLLKPVTGDDVLCGFGAKSDVAGHDHRGGVAQLRLHPLEVADQFDTHRPVALGQPAVVSAEVNVTQVDEQSGHLGPPCRHRSMAPILLARARLPHTWQPARVV